MIVVMHKGATPDEVENARKRIEDRGFTPHLSSGVEYTVIGVLGQPVPQLKDELEMLPGVSEVVSISKPYKLSSREFKSENTIVKIGDVSIGSDDLVVMAGPCSVENEEQMVSTAHAVKAGGGQHSQGWRL